MFKKETKKFSQKTFDHYKAIGATQNGLEIINEAGMTKQPGVITDSETFADGFVEAIAKYRHWDREIEEF